MDALLGAAKRFDTHEVEVCRADVAKLQDEHTSGTRELTERARDESSLIDTSVSSERASSQHAARALLLCQAARSGVQEAVHEQEAFLSALCEIRKRKRMLHEILSSVDRIQRLTHAAGEAELALQQGLFLKVTDACRRFESSNAAASPRLDQTFLCLGALSNQVSLVAVSSLHGLRQRLDQLCEKFEVGLYMSSLHSFRELGAGREFLAHFFSAFEAASSKDVKDAMTSEAESVLPRALRLVELFTGRLAAFYGAVQFHHSKIAPHTTENPDWCCEDEELRLELRDAFAEAHERLFHHLNHVGSAVIGAFEAALAAQPPVTLLKLLTACGEFQDAAPQTTRDDKRVRTFRAQRGPVHECKNVNEQVHLRRGKHVIQGSVKNRLNSQKELYTPGERNVSSTAAEGSIRAAVESLAHANVRHLHSRNVEQLFVLAQGTESWTRMQLSPLDIQSILEKTQSCITFGTVSSDDVSSWTFTVGSCVCVRWILDYVHIGMSEDVFLSQTLESIVDLTLSLLFIVTAVCESRVIPDSESFLTFVGDLLQDRPSPKDLSSFLSVPARIRIMDLKDRFRKKGGLALNFSHESDLLPGYSQASAYSLQAPPASISTGAITRLCVAAESLNTLTKVVAPVSKVFEERLRAKDDAARKVATMTVCVKLASEIRLAIYKLLAWDIIGGWSAVTAVAESCLLWEAELDDLWRQSALRSKSVGSEPSTYVQEMMARVKCAHQSARLPPEAAELLAIALSEASMDCLLEGFSCIGNSTTYGGQVTSQMLMDVRSLEMALTEHTGLHPLPGLWRTEAYVKARFLAADDLNKWVEDNQRRLNLSQSHISALSNTRFENGVVLLE